MEINKEKLAKALIDEGIKRQYYSLEGGLPDDALCLKEKDNQWIVYYSERGQIFDAKTFNSEIEACSYFFTEAVRAFKKYK